MAIKLPNNKRIDLRQLQGEIVAGGLAVTALSTDADGTLMCHGGTGAVMALQPAQETICTTAIAAHVAAPLPNPQFGTDAVSISDATVDTTVANLRAYIADGAPTNASRVACVKLLCRVCLALIRRVL